MSSPCERAWSCPFQPVLMKDGMIKVAAAVCQTVVADVRHNTEEIESLMARADGMGIDIVCFPELAVTGYTCQDLFGQQLLLERVEAALLRLMEFSRNVEVVSIVGVPVAYRGMLFNCAAVLHRGVIHGFVPKTFVPEYNEFYERRWFTSASALEPHAKVSFCGQSVPLSSHLLFSVGGILFGIEICEDLWAPIPPSSALALAGAEVIFNLSASNELVGKAQYLRQIVTTQSARSLAGYVYTSSGPGESTQDVVFGGRGFIAESGRMLAERDAFPKGGELTVAEIDVDSLRSDRRKNTTFAAATALVPRTSDFPIVEVGEGRMTDTFTLTREIDPLPFVPKGDELLRRSDRILTIQAEGLMKRLVHTHAKTAVIGISGGLDSTLALLVTVCAFDRLGLDRKGIVGVTMPGFGTTNRTYTNAVGLIEALGVTFREISIRKACEQHFADIGHDSDVHDVTYENSQARERTQILMDVANQVGGMVVGTGDLSELALGWATYNGDHMSMYGVNASVPKTLVKHLVNYVACHLADEQSAAFLKDIVDTPISPELIPAKSDGTIKQITEDLVGPYELHDFFLYHTLRHGRRPAKVFRLAQHAFDGHDDRVARYSDETIKQWLTTFYRRFFAQQFKRSCLPDGPKIGSCSLSPRGDWRMPTDASSAEWLAECSSL